MGDGKTCTKKPVEYVVVTAANGTAHASSVYSGNYKPIEAFTNQARDYWCSIERPQAPVCLWFQFNEAKRIVKIKFDEPYKMSGEDGYEVFASNEVGNCGEKDNQLVLAVKAAGSVFKTGMEFKNALSFRCYGIRTNDWGRRDYVAVKNLQFGVEDVDDCQPNPCVHGTCTDGVNSHTCQCTPGYRGDNCDEEGGSNLHGINADSNLRQEPLPGPVQKTDGKRTGPHFQ